MASDSPEDELRGHRWMGLEKVDEAVEPENREPIGEGVGEMGDSGDTGDPGNSEDSTGLIPGGLAETILGLGGAPIE